MIKKSDNGDYKFDPVGLIKMIGFVAVLVASYFIQDARIQALEYRVTIMELGIENIDLKLDKLIKTNDSLVIVLKNK